MPSSDSDAPLLSSHLNAFNKACAELDNAKLESDLSAQAKSAFRAAVESLKAAAARYGIEHESSGGLMDLSERLSKVIGAPCLPSRLASILCLDSPDSLLRFPPSRIKKVLAKAEDIAFNLADIARGKSTTLH